MRRPTTAKTATVYSASATGGTQAGAKALAIARIERVFLNEWDFVAPAMQRFPKDHVGLVYRTLDGWEYQLLWAGEETKSGYAISRYATAAEADRAMRRHLAQQYVDVLPDHGMSVLQAGDHEGRREQVRYVRFQHAYRRFQAQNHPDWVCHRLACEAMGTPEEGETAS